MTFGEFREGIGRDKAVKENLRDDDEDRRVRVFATVPRDKPDVRALEAPLFHLLLELRVFLFRQRDERRRIIRFLIRPKRLVNRRFRDQRLPHPRGGADERSMLSVLLRSEPRVYRFFLKRIRIELEFVKIVPLEVFAIDAFRGLAW